MDANEFIKEAYRMCNCHNCDECPARGGVCIVSMSGSSRDWERNRYIIIVEKWSKEHPVIKNRDKFKEVFGGDWCQMFDNLIENSRPGVSNVLSDFLESEYTERKEK